jgi:hypothetical protein
MGGRNPGRSGNRWLNPRGSQIGHILIDGMSFAGTWFASQKNVSAGFKNLERLVLGHVETL